MFTIVKKAVDAADPLKLLEHGAPDDEYDSESEAIAAGIKLTDDEEKIAENIAEVFSKAFSYRFEASAFRGVAYEVWNELHNTDLDR